MIDRPDLVVKNEKVAYDSSQEPFYKHMLLKEVLVLPAKGQKAAHVQVEAEKKKPDGAFQLFSQIVLLNVPLL